MRVNGKLMGGLAWLGVIALVAVPSAEFVSSQFEAEPGLTMTSDARYVETAAVTTDPVDKLISTGKPLPSYISDAPKPVVVPKPAVEPAAPLAAVAPAPVKTTPLAVPDAGNEAWAPVQTASVKAGDAPVPMPATMRPVNSAGYEPVPILDEAEVRAREAALTSPLADLPVPVLDQPRVVEGDDLDGWESGSLADFLASRGLLSDGTRSRATVTRSDASYDPDGFFLDEGPNATRRRLPPSEIEDDGEYFVVTPGIR